MKVFGGNLSTHNRIPKTVAKPVSMALGTGINILGIYFLDNCYFKHFYTLGVLFSYIAMTCSIGKTITIIRYALHILYVHISYLHITYYCIPSHTIINNECGKLIGWVFRCIGGFFSFIERNLIVATLHA